MSKFVELEEVVGGSASPKTEEEVRQTLLHLKLEKHPLEMAILKMKKQKLEEELRPLTARGCCKKLAKDQGFRLKLFGQLFLLFITVLALINASLIKDELQQTVVELKQQKTTLDNDFTEVEMRFNEITSQANSTAQSLSSSLQSFSKEASQVQSLVNAAQNQLQTVKQQLESYTDTELLNESAKLYAQAVAERKAFSSPNNSVVEAFLDVFEVIPFSTADCGKINPVFPYRQFGKEVVNASETCDKFKPTNNTDLFSPFNVSITHLPQTTTFGNVGTGYSKWSGGVLAPNGLIFGIPYSSATVLVIDPATKTATTFGDVGTGVGKWFGGVLAPNGLIFGIPRDSATVLVIDPATKTATTFGDVGTGYSKWSGGVLAPNGLIFGIPYSSATVLVIDPATKTATTFGDMGTGANKWVGGVLAPNGLIFGIPASSSSVLVIDTNATSVSPKWLLSPYYNKF